MLLLLASRYDQAAQALVQRWEGQDARLLTCRDLSTAGWRYYPNRPQASRAVVGGQPVPVEEVVGVLTRLPSVTEGELPFISEADRNYVAAEMTAFLIAWLSEAAFPVINRPTPACLMGPSWHLEQWLQAAAGVGMRVRETRRLIALGVNDPGAPVAAAGVAPVTVTVVGDRCLGQVADPLAEQARRLAAVAGVELLAVEFSGPDADATFLGAYLGPDVSRPEVADALLDCFRPCTSPAC